MRKGANCGGVGIDPIEHRLDRRAVPRSAVPELVEIVAQRIEIGFGTLFHFLASLVFRIAEFSRWSTRTPDVRSARLCRSSDFTARASVSTRRALLAVRIRRPLAVA